jgi:hypothetical protein
MEYICYVQIHLQLQHIILFFALNTSMNPTSSWRHRYLARSSNSITYLGRIRAVTEYSHATEREPELMQA